jgi:hypothetical protein
VIKNANPIKYFTKQLKTNAPQLGRKIIEILSGSSNI